MLLGLAVSVPVSVSARVVARAPAATPSGVRARPARLDALAPAPALLRAPAAYSAAAAELSPRVFDGSLAPASEETPVPQPSEPSRPEPGERRGLTLAISERSLASLRGRLFALNEWQYLAFSLVTDAGGLGEALIDGKPAAESQLEFKHVVRPVVEGEPVRLRHDYSLLAIGATPERVYEVAFPAGGLSFSVAVEHLDRSTPEERAASTKKLMRAALERKEKPSVTFSAEVPEGTRRLFEPHHSIMARLLEEHETYLEKDEIRDEALESRRADLASLRAFYADVAAGRVRYETAPLAAQLLARERRLLNDYRAYLLADPAMGRVAARLRLGQIDHYREILETLRGVYAQIDESRRPGPVERLMTGALGLWVKFRAWLAARGRF